MDQDSSTPLGSILVTGATGKVGRRLVAELLRTGHRVAIVTRSSDAAQTLWQDQGPGRAPRSAPPT
jgi:UDP-glucose 4-epimerase